MLCMKRLLGLGAAMILVAAVFGCDAGSRNEDGSAGPVGTTPGEQAAQSPSEDAGSERFVLGAIPGKPAVYWIHTDW